MSNRQPTPSELPDVFRFEHEKRVSTAADWERRRRELRDILLAIEYGPLPPVASTSSARLHVHRVPRFLDAHHEQYRLTVALDPPLSFVLDLLIPGGTGPSPVVLTADGCWRHLSDEITLEVLRRGYLLAELNRVEIYPDDGATVASGGAPIALRHGYGALAAWAWGYHRAVDFLSDCRIVDPARIAVIGHSRGGKASLLAGATDERIALVGANGSGCGGAGCFRHRGNGSETLRDILGRFAFWFAPALSRFAGNEDELPLDQHYLKALVAPRALITTEALGDLWANPRGTWQTHLAAREVYRFRGATDRIGISYREGGHEHALADWLAFLDFADWQLRGSPPAQRFDANPFPDDPAGFSWSAPGDVATLGRQAAD